MSDDSSDRAEQKAHAEQALSEAAERQRRLQIWLDGMLAGGPPLSGATQEWREGMAFYEELEHLPTEPDDNSKAGDRVAESLLKIRQGVRSRRELTGKPPLNRSEDEMDRRMAQVLEALHGDAAEGKESTPLHMVFAARFVEGELDWEQYRSAILGL